MLILIKTCADPLISMHFINVLLIHTIQRLLFLYCTFETRWCAYTLGITNQRNTPHLINHPSLKLLYAEPKSVLLQNNSTPTVAVCVGLVCFYLFIAENTIIIFTVTPNINQVVHIIDGRHILKLKIKIQFSRVKTQYLSLSYRRTSYEQLSNMLILSYFQSFRL